MRLKAGAHGFHIGIQNSICITHEQEKNALKREIPSTYLSGYNLVDLKPKKGRVQPVQREAAIEIVEESLVGTE